MPDGFLRRVVQEEFNKTLPPVGSYGAGNIFFPRDAAAVAECKAAFERHMARLNIELIGWRKVPVDNSELGPTSLESEPHTEMLLVKPGEAAAFSPADFNRELYRLRIAAAKEIHQTPAFEDFYVSSLNTGTLVYKGQLTPEQVWGYFKDLQQPDYTSHLALVHSRFSTNTFPSWSRAQPFRSLCHNGEINTLRGNKNMMRSREALLESRYFGSILKDEITPICSDDMSDSGNFDAVAELLNKGGDRPLHEAVMMMVPEAWQQNPHLSDDKRAFYSYYANMMEPWDGPAMMSFTDGRYVGACLDRNGLRPSRYYVTRDDRVLLSSEVGVLVHLQDDLCVRKERLEPGKMFLIDFEEGRIIPDGELKAKMSTARPYREWMEKGPLRIDEWVAQAGKPASTLPPRNELNNYLSMFGFTREAVDILVSAMAKGKEALGSMGVDTPLAALSLMPRAPSHYFKQLFAQVTNPPIDPIREEVVMSLQCPVGPEANLLDASEKHAQRLLLPHPVLSLEEMAALKTTAHRSWTATTLDSTFGLAAAKASPDALREALVSLCAQAEKAVKEDKAPLLILSDRSAGPDRLPIPSLVACGAVHQHLIKTKLRTSTGLLIESGDAKEPHDFCTLIGYGADGICPYGAYAAVSAFHGSLDTSADKEMATYRKSAGKAILKVMSKIGISTVQSYKGAQIFEAIGLGPDIMEMCFTGTASRLKGIGFDYLQKDVMRLHSVAWPEGDRDVMLPNPGDYHYRDGGEKHYNSPQAMAELQVASKTNSRKAYEMYARTAIEQSKSVSIRGLLTFRSDVPGVPIEEVESAAEIVKRFCTGAMSLGSISSETHEALAIAMNTLGGKSNTGEGGEDPRRFADNRRSSIKQIASGRFGVTSEYLTNADELQIKMAQGAKPGEGGELPGYKVTELIAKTRGTTQGVGLISPPPHHDIYSIEDLAQLIHDLKSANRSSRVSTKLVSEVGVGVVAAGVAKAKSDHIVISGGDGGTGAAAWTGIKHAGLPWELGLAETHQTLVLNRLRSRVVLQADGQLKSGKDVVIAALLGAEEYGFATAPLIALGCIMMRKCHLNTCPVGIATQDPELRKKFAGKPEHVINFFFLMAEEMRGYMAQMGFRTMSEMIGRADMLRVDEEALTEKSRLLDLGPILTPAAALAPGEPQINTMSQDHFSKFATGLDSILDHELIVAAEQALKDGTPVTIDASINNLNRCVGTMLSNEISKRYGAAGLPDGTITVNLKGQTGQSFGFTLAKGVTLNVSGDANDGCGKGLSGGEIYVTPQPSTIAAGLVPEDNVVVGNVALYGATSGRAFFRGKAGERFCVRNSGAITVVEGMGDHGCEYMTGGRVVCLGETGINFGAGMSGGIAYMYDPNSTFAGKCNMEMVGLEEVGDAEEIATLKGYLESHVQHTGSTVAANLLAQWPAPLKSFIKVMPHDYKRVLLERAAAADAAAAEPIAASAA
uniref:Glutamine amidotransferase type-2 domain-containing protein n=1 Tax=Chrysotila carterae TaxID=13221 RepID=A0A7S4F7M2_CHRCT